MTAHGSGQFGDTVFLTSVLHKDDNDTHGVRLRYKIYSVDKTLSPEGMQCTD